MKKEHSIDFCTYKDRSTNVNVCDCKNWSISRLFSSIWL